MPGETLACCYMLFTSSYCMKNSESEDFHSVELLCSSLSINIHSQAVIWGFDDFRNKIVCFSLFLAVVFTLSLRAQCLVFIEVWI